MNIGRLVEMANDIGHYFAAEPDRGVAVAGIANHLQRYWDPRMRRAIVAHVQQGGAGLDELARAAVNTLQTPP
jgi:formate dehydrogenase subunit delta